MRIGNIAAVGVALGVSTGLGLVTVPTARSQDLPLEARVQGTVREAASGAPIANARVRLQKSRTRATVETVSDLSGRFTVTVREAGLYFVFAEADGYVTPSALEELPPKILIRPGTKRLSIDPVLHRSVTVRGRIVDQQTEAPVPNFRVRPLTARYIRGRLTLLPVGPAVDATTDGRFHLHRLPPGRYVLEIAPEQAESIELGPAPRYDSRNPRPRRYSRIFWPPGSEFADVPPLEFRAGGSYDLGTIPIRSSPAYHVAGSVEEGGCRDEDQIRVSLTQRFGNTTLWRVRASVPCGSPFTLGGLAPNADYRLTAWISGQDLDRRAFFQAELRLATADLDLPVLLRPPRRVTCRIELQDRTGAEPPKEVPVRIRPLGSLAFSDEPTVKSALGEDFILPLFERAEQEVIVRGLRHPYYLRELIYNGHRIPGRVFTPDHHALEHSLRIVIGSDGSGVRGAVRDSDDFPAAGVVVILAPWPPRYRGEYPEVTTMWTDDEGNFEVLSSPWINPA